MGTRTFTVGELAGLGILGDQVPAEWDAPCVRDVEEHDTHAFVTIEVDEQFWQFGIEKSVDWTSSDLAVPDDAEITATEVWPHVLVRYRPWPQGEPEELEFSEPDDDETTESDCEPFDYSFPYLE